MKVFVAGPTGVVGRRATEQLVEAGHDVTGVARSEEKVALLERLGARAARVDLFDPAAVAVAVAGHDAVLNLATHIPASSRALVPGAWAENDRIRSEASRNLVDAAYRAGAERYVQESITFIYPDRADAWITEDVAPDVPPHVLSALAAEGHAARFREAGGTGVVLRFAMFVAPDSAHTRDTVRLTRRRIAALPGRRDAFASSIHADDAAAAVVAALTAPSGIYNVTDDEPLTRADLFAALAGVLGVAPPRFVPEPVARLGGSKVSMLARSQRVAAGRFKEVTGWQPRFASLRVAWPAVVAAMDEEALSA